MTLQGFASSALRAVARQWPGVDLTYRLFVDVTFNTATGVQEPTYHQVAVRNAQKGTASVRDVGAAPSVLQLGDLRLKFFASDLAEHLRYAKAEDLSTADLIELGGATYRVVAWDEVANGTRLRVFARAAR